MAPPISAHNNRDNGEGWISQLPVDILVHYILPKNIKEAAKTSIISKRWRYLWANFTHLDFNHLIVLPESEPTLFDYCPFIADEKNKYINWVNQVVAVHCGPCIHTFKIEFNFDYRDVDHIAKWVTFALLKKVQNLQLSLFSQEVVYTLPPDILKQPSMGDVNFLKSLHLRNVNVNGEVLEYLLSHCCHLERLYVDGSQTLMRLRVAGLSCKLKQLTISCCLNFKDFFIDDANLEYLAYASGNANTNVVFKSIPMLVEADFAGYCFVPSCSIFPHISHLAAQFSTLHLSFLFCGFPTGDFPTFGNLKRLTLEVSHRVHFELADTTKFLKACPTLCELKFEIMWLEDELMEESSALANPDICMGGFVFPRTYDWEYFDNIMEVELERTNLPNLKQLQVGVFNGCTCDVLLILLVLLLAPNLEAIICDTTGFEKSIAGEVIEASKSRATKLAKLIPSKINLHIL